VRQVCVSPGVICAGGDYLGLCKLLVNNECACDGYGAKEGKGCLSVVFKKNDGSAVCFKARFTRSKTPAGSNKRKSSDTGPAASKKRSKSNPPAEAP